MHLVYMITAILGGSILVIQFVLMIIGFDGDADADVTDFELDEAGVGGTEFFDYLSLKSIFSFLTFFGLAGLGVEAAAWNFFPGDHIVAAIAAGMVAFYIVGLIMVSFRRLESSGNVDLIKTVGESGTVYLRVPGDNQGAGKVNVTIQGRTVELRAITYGEELPTGAKVKVVAYLKPDTVEVTPQL